MGKTGFIYFNVKFLIHPNLAKRIEKRPDDQVAFYNFIRKLVEFKTSGLVPKKLKNNKSMRESYEMRVSIKLRILYSKVIHDSKEKYFFWDLVNHDKIKNGLCSLPEAEKSEAEFIDAYEILNVDDDAIDIYSEETGIAIRDWSFDDSILKVGNDDLFNKMSQGKITDFPWYIHTCQLPALKETLPVCVNGSAGTGKTTVGIYRLINEVRRDKCARVIYITYNNNLIRMAKRIAGSIATDEEITRISFYTYNDFCRHITGDRRTLCTEEIFREKFYKKYIISRSGKKLRLNPSRLWAIIRSSIKGALDNTERYDQIMTIKSTVTPYLGVYEYENLPRNKKADLDTKILFDAVDVYKNFLEQNSMIDELDLAREAIENINISSKTYDLVFCDEVQDLTEMQIILLFIITNTNDNKPGIFLTGDESQCIQPSEFSWPDVSRIFFRKYNINKEITKLTKNFRCSNGIVKFANNIQQIRQRRWGKIKSDTLLIPVIHGDDPFFIDVNRSEKILSLEEIGPDTMIITNSKEDGDLLVKKLNLGANVFNIYEAKGLEYEHVVIYNYLDDLIKALESENTKNNPEVRFIFNVIYIAATRAVQNLFIVDSRENYKICLNNGVFDNITEIDWGEFNERQISPDGSWENKAWELFNRERYLQACYAFKRAGMIHLASKSSGYMLIQSGEFEKAFDCFINNKLWDDAIAIIDRVNKGYKVLLDSVLTMESCSRLIVNIISNIHMKGQENNGYVPVIDWINSTAGEEACNRYIGYFFENEREKLIMRSDKIYDAVIGLM